MKFFNIDIEKFKSEIGNFTNMENFQTITRRIMTEILRNQINENKSGLLVGYSLYEYISDSPSFCYSKLNNTKLVIPVGTFYQLSVFVDSTSTLKDNEYFLFNDISELDFIKKIIRTKKLERILCQD